MSKAIFDPLDIIKMLDYCCCIDVRMFAQDLHNRVEFMKTHSKTTYNLEWTNHAKEILHNLIIFNKDEIDAAELSKKELKTLTADIEAFNRMMIATNKRAMCKCSKAIESAPSDDYDSMSKEQLIAILRSRK